MFEGQARLVWVGERGQVDAEPLGTRLPHVQPGADRAHRWDTPGRQLGRECLDGLGLQRISPRQPVRSPRTTVPAPGTWAARMIIMSSS